MNKTAKKTKNLLKLSPIAMVVVGLLVAGVASATAYNFFTARTNITIDEAIALSMMAGDDQQPYMEPEEGVLPKITPQEWGNGQGVTFTVTGGSGDGSEFTPGETLIIPVNLRNRSDAALPLTIVSEGATAAGLEVSFRIPGKVSWGNPIAYTMGGHEGAFGSALSGATVLLVKVHVPNECPAGAKSFDVKFSRGE